MLFLIGIIIVIIGLYLLYANRSGEEEYLVLKLIGYYLLGSFNFNLNGLVLPVGFAISFLFRPQVNQKIKRGAAIFGMIMMYLTYLFR